ncbi:lipopolysaccharide heptosyltransferase II [Bremerella alba]|uniref:lipopolysaccharide heptosyltransferase II n=1 Tax=Bremerella alba TaxID=980252 RepID=A0A7V9A8A5_9BACT|nr:lipopolysaccharide heptosyltransferase II [Bremerella alba]MBA2116242.1 ADP-heptose--LPS heptosyltransferase 2 [Bremerella alba]
MAGTRNIAVVLPNWIGDVVMATPTLRAIRDGLNTGDRLVGIMRPYVQDVLAGTSFLDDVMLWSKKAKEPSQRFLNVVTQVRQQRFDQAILLPNSISSAGLAYLGGVKQRIGYRRYGRGPLLTKALDPPSENGERIPVSAVDYYLSLAELAGYEVHSRHCELGFTDADDLQAQALWQQFRFFKRRVIVFNTGGAYGGAKHWPADYYAALARRLVEDPRNAVLLICGPSERETVAQIEREVKHPFVRSLAQENPSIGLSKAVINKASLMITTDSGPRHFAAAFGVPAVAIFGPTDPRWAENYNPHELILSAGIDCAPCAQRECPLMHHRCMRDLAVNDVLLSAQQQLDWQADQARAA